LYFAGIKEIFGFGRRKNEKNDEIQLNYLNLEGFYG
jgi:hypothetical protein